MASTCTVDGHRCRLILECPKNTTFFGLKTFGFHLKKTAHHFFHILFSKDIYGVVTWPFDECFFCHDLMCHTFLF